MRNKLSWMWWRTTKTVVMNKKGTEFLSRALETGSSNQAPWMFQLIAETWCHQQVTHDMPLRTPTLAELKLLKTTKSWWSISTKVSQSSHLLSSIQIWETMRCSALEPKHAQVCRNQVRYLQCLGKVIITWITSSLIVSRHIKTMLQVVVFHSYVQVCITMPRANSKVWKANLNAWTHKLI